MLIIKESPHPRICHIRRSRGRYQLSRFLPSRIFNSYPGNIIQPKVARPPSSVATTSSTYHKRLRNATMEPIPFTQNFTPLGDTSLNVASNERSSTMESQTAVEVPPTRFAISPQDIIKSNYVTFPSFPEPEESGVPERPEMPPPCPSCFPSCLSWYPRQKKEKAIEVPTRSRSCCKKVLSLFSRRTNRKTIQDPAPSSSYCTTILSLFSRRSKLKVIQDPAPSPSCSPAFAAFCVRRNKGKAREEESLLHPSPFVAR